RISDRIPIPSPALPASQVMSVLERLAGSRITRPLRVTIDAAVFANDDRDALAAAMGPTLELYRVSFLSAFRDQLDHGHVFDVIGALARHTREHQQQILGHLRTVRAAARFTPVITVLSALLFAAGVVTLLVIHRSNRRTAALVLAGVLPLAGISTFAAWWAV